MHRRVCTSRAALVQLTVAGVAQGYQHIAKPSAGPSRRRGGGGGARSSASSSCATAELQYVPYPQPHATHWVVEERSGEEAVSEKFCSRARHCRCSGAETQALAYSHRVMEATKQANIAG